ncbi:MAG: hypothetical protein AB4372_33885 [Xenococcus sp. (in: cyanobacteria)]
MSSIPLCRIVITSPNSDIKILETALRIRLIKVEKSPNWLVGNDHIVLVATMIRGLTTRANILQSSQKIARTIIIWRNQLRSRGIELEGILEYPERLPLNLNQAQDKEIEEWFSAS